MPPRKDRKLKVFLLYMDLYTYAYWLENLKETRLPGRPQYRQKDITLGLKKVDWEVKDWIQLPRNTEKCRVLQNTVINHHIQLDERNSL